jgi:hypothetical protein
VAEILTVDGEPADPGPSPEFAKAMAAPEPGQQAGYRAPPKRDPDAPHGRDSGGTPLAPHGYKPDGKPRAVPPGPGRGHTGKDDAARVQKPGGKKPAPAALPAADLAEVTARRAGDATTTLELLSAGGTLLAMVRTAKAQAAYQKADAAGDKAATKKAQGAHGRAQVLQLDAAAFALHADSVGPAVAEAASHNAMAAALVDRLSLFNGVASVGLAVMPLIYQVIANHAPAEVHDDFPPALLSLGVLPPPLLLEKLQAQNAVKMARAQAEILAERNEAEEQLAALREQAA